VNFNNYYQWSGPAAELYVLNSAESFGLGQRVRISRKNGNRRIKKIITLRLAGERKKGRNQGNFNMQKKAGMQNAQKTFSRRRGVSTELSGG